MLVVKGNRKGMQNKLLKVLGVIIVIGVFLFMAYLFFTPANNMNDIYKEL